MRQLATYAFINAKVRAMLSYLIDPSVFASLIDSKSLYEFLELIKNTQYRSVFSETNPDSMDLFSLERKLISGDISIFKKVYEAMSGKTEKEFIMLLAQRYEIEDLKVILRLWHSKEPVNVKDYISGEKIKNDIDYKAVAAADTIEEVIILLDKTDYKEPLLVARDKFKSTKSMFYLEASLDVDYYQRLLDCVNRFSAVDRKIASKILAIEVDSENIQWLIRTYKYYSLGLGDAIEWLMPGGAMINKNKLRDLYSAGGFAKIIESIALGPYIPIKDLAQENMHFIENFLYEVMLKEVKKVLGSNPFTIGTVFGYLILKRRETKSLISLLYAKSCGVKKEDISRLISA